MPFFVVEPADLFVLPLHVVAAAGNVQKGSSGICCPFSLCLGVPTSPFPIDKSWVQPSIRVYRLHVLSLSFRIG